VSHIGKLRTGGQTFIGSADLGHPANGVFDLARKDIPAELLKIGMTGKLEVPHSGTHTVEITRREGTRLHFKILT
jgi:hypothetical protein